MKETKRYKLAGYIIVTNWYGHKGFKKLIIDTDEKGLEEIKKDPRQDYINYGVRSVDYAYFEVYPYTVTVNENTKTTTESLNPTETIEDGKRNLTPEEESVLIQDIPTEITY